MESNAMPITKQEMTELLNEHLGGIHTKLDSHENLLETLTTEMSVVQDILRQHDKRFNHHDDLLETVASEVHATQEILHRHDKRFDQLDTLLDRFDTRLNHFDDLLETVASEVNTVSTIIEPLVPVQRDHEERISRLERGYTRMLLKS